LALDEMSWRVASTIKVAIMHVDKGHMQIGERKIFVVVACPGLAAPDCTAGQVWCVRARDLGDDPAAALRARH
jgi:hypothetical protein